MALTGQELLYVNGLDATGNLAATLEPTTTGAIAALASLETTSTVITALATVGAGTITAAGIIGGVVKRGGSQSSTAFTDTTDTAAAIIAALPAGAGVGSSWEFKYINNTNAVATIAHGTGVTINSGSTPTTTVTVPANGEAEFLVTYASAGAVTMVRSGFGSYTADAADTTKVFGYTLSGQTTATTALLATQNTANAVYTLPVATDTLVGRASQDTFTNKTFDTAGSGNVFKINGTQISAITGTGSSVLATGPTLSLPVFGGTGAVFNGSSSGTTTVLATAAAGTTTLTLPAVTGTVASTTGANLAVTDIYRSTAGLNIQNSVTPTVIQGLAGAVAIGTYKMRAVIISSPASTGGLALSFVLTTAVLGVCNFQTLGYVAAGTSTITTTTTATSGTALYAVATIPVMEVIEGTFTVTTAGTFSLYGCQNTQVNSAAVVNIGSYLELTRIA